MKSYFKVLAISAIVAVTAACSGSQKGIKIIPDDAQKKIDILYDGKLFTSYVYPDDHEVPALYPVYTSNGTDITRGYPRKPRYGERPDHPHHLGAWFSYGDVNGIDFWGNSFAIPADQKPKYGSIRYRNTVSIKGAALTVATDWVDHYGKLLLKEESTFKFSGSGDWRIIERITVLTAQQETVTFGDTKEGMIAFRLDRVFEEPTNRPERFFDAQGNLKEEREMNDDGKNGMYRNSEGLEKERGVWGKPTKWVSLSAEKDGEKISLAIIDHKNNPGHPAHSHARGYGLFSTNNMGAKAFNENNPLFQLTLKLGQSTTFRHLLVIKTNGFVTDDEMNKLFTDFNKAREIYNR